MNISAISRRMLFATGLALAGTGMAVTPSGAQELGGPTIATSGQTSITTDKDAYLVGERVIITYTLPGPGWYRITDQQGGKLSTLRSGYSAQTTNRFSGTVTPPAGKECLYLHYWNSFNQTSTAETCFQVTDKADPGQQMIKPGIYTLRSRYSGNALDSNLEKKLYMLGANGGSFQKWVLETGPDGYFFLRNLATGYYVDDSSPIGHVVAAEKNLGIYQQWKVVPGREGSWLLVNRETGRALYGTPQGVYTNDDHPTVPDPYEWKLAAVQP